MNLHPQVIEKEGRKEFVVLPYDEFLRIQDELDDFEDLRDLRDLRDAKENSASEETHPLSQVKDGLLSE